MGYRFSCGRRRGRGFYTSHSGGCLCLKRAHTHTADSLATHLLGVAWARGHVWQPAPAAGLALSTPAGSDLRLTHTSLCTSITVHLPHVSGSPAKWVCLSHSHTHTFLLDTRQRDCKKWQQHAINTSCKTNVGSNPGCVIIRRLLV